MKTLFYYWVLLNFVLKNFYDDKKEKDESLSTIVFFNVFCFFFGLVMLIFSLIGNTLIADTFKSKDPIGGIASIICITLIILFVIIERKVFHYPTFRKAARDSLKYSFSTALTITFISIGMLILGFITLVITTLF